MNTYIVLIGDIESSKDLEEAKRHEVQHQLQKVLEEINDSYPHIESPYTVTLGDEFQAVLSRADHFFQHAWKIMAALYPVKVRFSVGIGEIATPINHKQALGMDGPAFHIARDGIEFLKEHGFIFKVSLQDQKTAVLSALNNSLYLFSGQLRRWNKNRLSILYMLEKGMDYKEITGDLGISEPAFYKNKEAASLDVVMDLCQDIAEILNTWVAHELRDISFAAEPDTDFET